MKTGIVTTNTYLNHNTGQGHPENAARVSVVIENLKKIKKLKIKILFGKNLTNLMLNI